EQRGEHTNERRLAGSVRPQKAERLALLDGERDPVDRGEVAESLHDLADIDRDAHGEWRWSSGRRTYAVMPSARRRSWLSMRRRISNVLMSRLVRLTSRCVAKSASTPRKNTVPCRSSPHGSRTVRCSPNRTRSMYVSSTSARTQRLS